MKITFLLQTFNKVDNLQLIHDNLINQISKVDSTKYELNILIIQDNIVGCKKEKDENYSKNYNKVIEMNKKLSKNEITEYYLNDKNLKPCLTISNGIDYIFMKYKSDFFVTLEDDLIISNNFVEYFIYIFENIFDKENILYVAAESVFFDSRENSVTTLDKNLNIDLINLFELEKFYTKFNFLPSTNFGTNLIGWNAIREVRRTQNPSGATMVQSLFKELNYETVMPIVPRCKDIGMNDELGYSTSHKRQRLEDGDEDEVKNTYILSETAYSTMYPFFYNKDKLFERSCLMRNRNYDEVDMLQESNINIGDILNECILKYLGNYYVNTPNDKDDQKKDDTTKDNLSLKTNKNLSIEHGALLLSTIIDNELLIYITSIIKKKYKIGIITDKIIKENSKKDVKVIDINNNLSNLILECLECEYIISSFLDAIVICDVLKIPNYIVNFSSTSQIKCCNEYHNFFNINVNNEEILCVTYEEILNKENDLSKIISYVKKKYMKKDFILLSELNEKIIKHYSSFR